jgi:ABC-type transporter Mla subunit MlaD
VTQLRPAARQLSPTLQQLSALSPDLKSFFRNLGPAITASKSGLPATRRFLTELAPALGELDPPLRQLGPPIEALTSYKSELSAFFANSAAATQAATPDGKHYLRTTNPLNPESVAVSPNRLPSNRNNAYEFPRLYDQLKQGMESFETRQCTRAGGQPSLSALPSTFLSDDLRARVLTYAFNGSTTNVAAPPCRPKGPFVTFLSPGSPGFEYPHVGANRRLIGGGPFSTAPTPTARAASVPGG